MSRQTAPIAISKRSACHEKLDPGKAMSAAESGTTRSGDNFDIEVYLDTSEPVPCTADLSPIPIQVSLGTLPSPDFTVTVNGKPVE